jgi:outer membrane protein
MIMTNKMQHTSSLLTKLRGALILLLGVVAMQVQAQKFALVDMEYILSHVPAYERANEQLNQVSRKWQAEVEALTKEVQTLYKTYQGEAVFLSDEQKKKERGSHCGKGKRGGRAEEEVFRPRG